MKLFLFPLVFVITTFQSNSQVLDEFDDGTFPDSPAWFGDTSDFVINNQEELQLKADTAGTSTLFLAADLPAQNISWSIDCFLDFNPSGINFITIYLVLDTPDLSLANGFALELGESGDEDHIKFLQLVNGQKQILAEGTNVHSQSPALRIEVVKVGGQWTLFSQSDAGEGIRLQELTYQSNVPVERPGYFAISCIYTSTRTDKFRFDNLLIQNEEPLDQTAPKVVAVDIIKANQLILQFSEPVEEQSAGDPKSYNISPDLGTPRSANLLADPTLVQLDLASDMTPNQSYELQVPGVLDLAGNKASESYSFLYRVEVIVQPFDVIINEIFDDPTPNFGLPEAEYLEVLVRKDGINLNQLVLSIGSKSITLPDLPMHLGEYIVLYNSKQSSTFQSTPGAIAVEGLPALVNSGSTITLSDLDGQIIQSISYDDTWYQQSNKKNGGWSLEMINPEVACSLAENWAASVSLSGGTPGLENSVLDLQSIPSSPKIINLVPIDSMTLRISLNKSHLTGLDPDQINISQGITVAEVMVLGSDQTELILTLERPLVRGNSYELSIMGLQDCIGQPYGNVDQEILIPEKMVPGDLIINEILFDPHTGGYDFVELYNRSNKALLLSDLKLANTQNANSVQVNRPFLVRPGAYVVLTPDPVDLQARYRVEKPEWIIKNDLPALPNDEGNITIYTSDDADPEIIDAFDYSKNQHFVLLKEKEGVSLERISPDAETQDSGNWHSASERSGFATPTGANSQLYPESLSDRQWQVDPKTFSPDGDGFEDYLLLSYSDLPPGTIVHVKIFDAAGRLVRYLVNNQSINTSGLIQWDGATDSGRIAPIGIYTIYIQSFGGNGEVQVVKETCVVAARLN